MESVLLGIVELAASELLLARLAKGAGFFMDIAEEEGAFLYRFDKRSPTEIAEAGGFTAWGKNEDLFEHVMGFSTSTGDMTSAYIATSKNELMLIEELQEGAEGYLYKIKNQTTGIDVSKSTDWRLEGKFVNENEIAVPNKIDINDIVSQKFIKK